MTARPRMLRRVTVRRVVAATCGATLLARPQVDPSRAALDAVFDLTPFGGFDGGNGVDVGAALIRHGDPSLMQHLMNEGDGNRSFTDCGGDALDVAAAHVSNRKDP